MLIPRIKITPERLNVNNPEVREFLLGFLIIGGIYLYFRKINVDNIVGRYYKANNENMYQVFKLCQFIISFFMFYNLKFLLFTVIHL